MPNETTGLGYIKTYLSGHYNVLQGINLSDGKVLWKKEVNRELGWNEYFMLNDSTILISACGLNIFNINSGKGWQYKAQTGDLNYKGAQMINF